MIKNLEIEIEFFGAFSHFKSEKPTILIIEENTKVYELKNKLYQKLKEYDDGNLENLINTSAIADDDRIYNRNENIIKAGKYAILPPVNGG